MKVLFLSFAFAEYSIRLASALAGATDVCLMLPDRLAEPHLARLNPALKFKPFDKPRLRQPRRQVSAIFNLWRDIRDYDPDVIHLQQGYLWFNPILPLLKQYPLVLTVHDPTPHVGDHNTRKTPQVVWDMGYRRASRIIVHNPQMRQAMMERGIAERRIDVLPTVVRGDDAAYPHLDEDDNLILFFGRIYAYKGLDYLIRAEPLITAQVPNARIMIAGKGEDFGRYRRLMRDPERFIVYNEFIPHEKVAPFFRRASVVALPYIDATQSGVIPTAYTFGKPVVATTVGGLPSMVEHGRTGYLVPPRDEQALAEAIIRLLQDKALRRKLGANGKRKVDSEYSAENVARKTLQVYEETVRETVSIIKTSAPTGY